MAKTMMQKVKTFATQNVNSGKMGLILLEQCIEHTFEHKDWTPLAWLISKCDATDNARLKRIAMVCVGGMTIKRDKDQPSGWRVDLGDNAAPSENFPLLSNLISDGESFRGKATTQAFFPNTGAADFDMKKYANTVLTRLEKNDTLTSDFMQAIANIIKERKLKVVEPKAAKS